MTAQDAKDYKNNNNCLICEKENISDKVRDHCHLTGKYRGPAHNNCNSNVKQKHKIFIPFIFHNFSNYDCHIFFRRLVDMKNGKVKFYSKPKTNEEYFSVTYGCKIFIDSFGIF